MKCLEDDPSVFGHPEPCLMSSRVERNTRGPGMINGCASVRSHIHVRVRHVDVYACMLAYLTHARRHLIVQAYLYTVGAREYMPLDLRVPMCTVSWKKGKSLLVSARVRPLRMIRQKSPCRCHASIFIPEASRAVACAGAGLIRLACTLC